MPKKKAPQAAYTCFLSGYKHKFNYYMRTISGIGNPLRKVEEVILTECIPSIKGRIVITENERKLLSLATGCRRLGIPIFEELCKIEYQNSIMILEHLWNHITNQFRRNEPILNWKLRRSK